MRYLSDDHGSATLLTMLMAIVIITLGIGFNWLVKEHIKASEVLQKKAEGVLKVRSAYDSLIYLILNGRMSPKEIVSMEGDALFQIQKVPLNGEKVSFLDDIYIQVQDCNGLLSLFNVNKEAMERLIKTVGGVVEASEIIDSYLDWVDSDEFVRLNGGEAFYYRNEGFPYIPRNYPIQFKEEFEWIKGMKKELYKRIEPYFTFLPSLGFNPNTASDEVLMAYLDINEDSLKILKNYISQKAVTSDLELFALTGRKIVHEEGIYFFPSPFLEMIITVGNPRSVYTLRIGVDTRQTIISPYSVLYWKEE